jgi:hypothetical protein
MSMKSRIPPRIYHDLMRRSRRRCEWCGSKDSCGIDHITPRCHGGTNRRSNLQYLCGRCGSWKGGDLPQRVINRLKRLKPKTDWARAVKSVGLRKMQEFLHRLEMEQMESVSGSVEGTFPNPLVISIGEGKVACQTALTADGGGIVFQLLDESTDVGSIGGSIVGDSLRQNQVFLVCRNRRGAEILKNLAENVLAMIDQVEPLSVLPSHNIALDENSSEE